VSAAITSETVSITPGLAAAWLADKAPNRRLRKRVVDRYANDMSQGRWRLTHQGIALDETGALIDGQHRLAAIVRSGVTVQMLVVRGVPRESQLDMDQHAKRGADDALSLAGFNADKTTVAIARSIYHSARHHKTDLSIEQLAAFITEHRAAIEFARPLVDRKVRGVSQSLVASAVARAFYHEDHERLTNFMDVLITGVQGDPPENDSAAVLLRNLLLLTQLAGGTNGSNANRRAAVYMKTVRAIELFCARKPIDKLYAASADRYLLPEDCPDEVEP